MNTKNIAAAVFAAGILLTGVAVLAKEGANIEINALRKASVSESPRASRTPSPAALACIASAVNVRETSLGTAMGTFSNAVKSAYSARASALAAAYAKTTTADIRTAVKAAWTQFNASSKAAGRDWKTAQKTAWSQFRTAAKACGGSSEINDSGNSSKEVSGD